MKVSVLLISYNHEKYIKQCVESILAQETPFKVEVIVADDCSTDATIQIISKLLLKCKFSYKVLDTHKNLGMHKNYQRGFAACSGEYIALMEGDDYWLDSRRLVKHIEYLEKNPECVMSFNRLIVKDEIKGTLREKRWDYPGSTQPVTTAMLAQGNSIGNLSACVIRRSAFMKLDPDIHELGFADWMLGMALGEQGFLVKLKEPMSVYRVHDKGIWHSKTRTDNLKNMIIPNIDKYDKYLGYRYHDEFMAYKKRLKSKLRKNIYKNNIMKYTPGFLKALIQFKICKYIWRAF